MNASYKKRCCTCGWVKWQDEFHVKSNECKTCKKAQDKDVKYGWKNKRATREQDFNKLMDISREQATFPGEEEE